MDRNTFLNEILPQENTLDTLRADALQVFDGVTNIKTKDIHLIKRTTREKVKINGSPIRYFPIDVPTTKKNSKNKTNVLQDQTDVVLGSPISMKATWTPQEYLLDLSKWGVMSPLGSDQQMFFHVDDIAEFIGRKPLIGDIVETVIDTMRYRISDVFFGNANLWENIFCMVSLSKVTRDNYTAQLDQFDTPGEESYASTYAALENVLNLASNSTTPVAIPKTNDEILKDRKSTYAFKEPAKRSIDTQVESIQDKLDLFTMKL